MNKFSSRVLYCCCGYVLDEILRGRRLNIFSSWFFSLKCGIAGFEIFFGVAIVLEELPHCVFDFHAAFVDLFESFLVFLRFGFVEFQFKGIE